MNLNDLPDEVLEQIFDELDVYELKLASLVCRRWAELTFSGQRMDRVWFILSDAYGEPMLDIKRPYRNIHQQGFSRGKVPFERLSRFLQTMKLPVRMLKICYGLTFDELRLDLLEVPELQHLSIKSNIDSNCKTNGPFPVLTKLKCLELNPFQSNLFDCFRMNVANLQSLYMSCRTDSELEIWRHLSGQLKLVHVYPFNSTYISQFLELTFPHLEDFTIEEVGYGTTEEIASSHDFFQRHSLLRRLSVGVPISVEWIRSFTSHCPELTYLSLLLMYPEEGILESLTQLTKLRHLSLNGTKYRTLNTKLFREAIKSLESVELEMHPTRGFLENLFENVPLLKCLHIKPIYDRFTNIALDFEFICEKFSCLRRLELIMYEKTLAVNSIRIDRLVLLEELKLWALNNIHSIHRNNVQCLTISHSITDDNLRRIPNRFPLLKRLILDCFGVSMAYVKRLHHWMPSCRIDFRSERFYPSVRRSVLIKARKS